MDINQLYSDKRLGKNETSNVDEIRSEFQRDFDRIIFSSAFRRLQNKTQVFPLPGSVFVHNRLTHSLEVASVGRSLGNLAGEWISNHFKNDLTEMSHAFYKYSLGNVISAACLCHDIGNPAFGHSGEDAIAHYFQQNESQLKPMMHLQEWNDLIHFEGNANSMRILTQQQNGKTKGGLLLTYATMAAIAKYPCESLATNKDFLHRKKFGFFQTEKSIFQEIAYHTQMKLYNNHPLIYLRHPFVWLVEAADDICYLIMDLEDAHRLGFIGHEVCMELLKSLLKDLQLDEIQKIDLRLASITDKNDRISYLRAKSIAALIQQSIQLYQQHFEQILKGELGISLLKMIQEKAPALKSIISFSETYIYQHRSVLEIENAGYNVMAKLLNHFIPSVIKEKRDRKKYDDKALQLMPKQFHYENESTYVQILGVLDYISGMTDNYATDLYRKIQGIDIGMTV